MGWCRSKEENRDLKMGAEMVRFEAKAIFNWKSNSEGWLVFFFCLFLGHFAQCGTWQELAIVLTNNIWENSKCNIQQLLIVNCSSHQKAEFHFGLIFSWDLGVLTFSTPPGLERQKDRTGDGGKQFPSLLSWPGGTRLHSADKLWPSGFPGGTVNLSNLQRRPEPHRNQLALNTVELSFG